MDMKVTSHTKAEISGLKNLYQKDMEIYNRDYNEYKDRPDIKPYGAGKPFLHEGEGSNSTGILLVHGYRANPEEVRPLGDYLHQRGFSVYGVRLPGSGTSSADLATRDYKEWLSAVERGRLALMENVQRVVLCGLSLGGALSLIAATSGDKYHAVISLSAPYRILNSFAGFAHPLNLWNRLCKTLGCKFLALEFLTTKPDYPHINYSSDPISGVVQVLKVIKLLRKSIRKVTIPALIIQGGGDDLIHRESPDKIYEGLSSINKELHILNTDSHIITMGEASEKVFTLVDNFLKSVIPFSESK